MSGGNGDDGWDTSGDIDENQNKEGISKQDFDAAAKSFEQNKPNEQNKPDKDNVQPAKKIAKEQISEFDGLFTNVVKNKGAKPGVTTNSEPEKTGNDIDQRVKPGDKPEEKNPEETGLGEYSETESRIPMAKNETSDNSAENNKDFEKLKERLADIRKARVGDEVDVYEKVDSVNNKKNEFLLKAQQNGFDVADDIKSILKDVEDLLSNKGKIKKINDFFDDDSSSVSEEDMLKFADAAQKKLDDGFILLNKKIKIKNEIGNNETKQKLSEMLAGHMGVAQGAEIKKENKDVMGISVEDKAKARNALESFLKPKETDTQQPPEVTREEILEQAPEQTPEKTLEKIYPEVLHDAEETIPEERDQSQLTGGPESQISTYNDIQEDTGNENMPENFLNLPVSTVNLLSLADKYADFDEPSVTKVNEYLNNLDYENGSFKKEVLGLSPDKIGSVCNMFVAAAEKSVSYKDGQQLFLTELNIKNIVENIRKTLSEKTLDDGDKKQLVKEYFNLSICCQSKSAIDGLGKSLSSNNDIYIQKLQQDILSQGDGDFTSNSLAAVRGAVHNAVAAKTVLTETVNAQIEKEIDESTTASNFFNLVKDTLSNDGISKTEHEMPIGLEKDGVVVSNKVTKIDPGFDNEFIAKIQGVENLLIVEASEFAISEYMKDRQPEITPESVKTTEAEAETEKAAETKLTAPEAPEAPEASEVSTTTAEQEKEEVDEEVDEEVPPLKTNKLNDILDASIQAEKETEEKLGEPTAATQEEDDETAPIPPPREYDTRYDGVEASEKARSTSDIPKTAKPTPYADLMNEIRAKKPDTTGPADKPDESEILKTQYEKTGIANKVKDKLELNAQEQEIKDRYDAMIAAKAAPDPVEPVKTEPKGDVDTKSPSASTQTRPPLKSKEEDEKWFGHKGPLETLAIILSGNLASPSVNTFLRRPLDYLVGSPLQAVGLAAWGATVGTGKVWLNSALRDAEGIQSAKAYRAGCFIEAGQYLYASFPVDVALLAKDLVTGQGSNAWNERNLTQMLRGKPFVNALATREARLANFDIRTGGVLDPSKIPQMSNAEKDMHELLRKQWNRDKLYEEPAKNATEDFFKKAPVYKEMKDSGYAIKGDGKYMDNLMARALSINDFSEHLKSRDIILPERDLKEITDLIQEKMGPAPLMVHQFKQGDPAFFDTLKKSYLDVSEPTVAPTSNVATPKTDPATATATLRIKQAGPP